MTKMTKCQSAEAENSASVINGVVNEYFDSMCDAGMSWTEAKWMPMQEGTEAHFYEVFEEMGYSDAEADEMSKKAVSELADKISDEEITAMFYDWIDVANSDEFKDAVSDVKESLEATKCDSLTELIDKVDKREYDDYSVWDLLRVHEKVVYLRYFMNNELEKFGDRYGYSMVWGDGYEFDGSVIGKVVDGYDDYDMFDDVMERLDHAIYDYETNIEYIGDKEFLQGIKVEDYIAA